MDFDMKSAAACLGCIVLATKSSGPYNCLILCVSADTLFMIIFASAQDEHASICFWTYLLSPVAQNPARFIPFM